MTDIRTLTEAGSTNDEMAAWAASGAADGSWLSAARQTGGRGRSGRPWVSPPGNLYASGLVRLRPGDPAPASLALVAAVALEEVLRALLPPDAAPMIKWPNDLLVDGAKIAGILLERRGEAVIVGIGVNLAHHPHDLDRAVTSVAALGGAVAAATDALAMLADAFARQVGVWRGQGLEAVRRAWLERAHKPGTALAARAEGRLIEGLFDGLDADGALRLRLAGGEVVTIHAGDVFLI
ncbi:biotin--[acetyl-CoA-carboxylase] ligase [Sphingomonas naphthae]|uniref:biotin--[biotin carboxyl-carrier protein] ligase n=1 Tax=Sphingomonas naphthae TaxID=1813468 RepID=A0ABY7TGD3_9SPHN|nr:biotin--[acetyl-CoA-carboxylase] ligase [Sphingomonas naphthae]WCT72288.1 biotin--[acetyl-CoA-carboxylase] ligase [Sphingomonas naphthae]